MRLLSIVGFKSISLLKERIFIIPNNGQAPFSFCKTMLTLIKLFSISSNNNGYFIVFNTYKFEFLFSSSKF